MFEESAIEKADLSGLDTSAVTDMASMFFGCGSLASLDLSSFDTSAVTDMSRMFDGCDSLVSLDLSSFDTSGVMPNLYDCDQLTKLYTSGPLPDHDVWRTTCLRGGLGTFFEGVNVPSELLRPDKPGEPGLLIFKLPGTTAITDVSASTMKNQAYTGKAITPAVELRYDGKTLVAGKDYKIHSYENNVNAGTAGVIVEGLGAYSGYKRVTFVIEQPAGNGKPNQGGSQGSATASSGSWKQDSAGWWYAYDKGGYPANSWERISGKWYRFNASGYMQTGWVQVGGIWYYLDSSGAMAEGWRSVGGEWYYLKPGSGAMATGWQQVGGQWYWLESSGAMATGWKSVGGTWYYLKSSGAMATGWAQVGGTWYYLKGSGAMATGWQQVGGSWYYLRSSGAMAANTWVDGVYWVGSSGAMATSAWVDNGRYYVGADGVWQK